MVLLFNVKTKVLLKQQLHRKNTIYMQLEKQDFLLILLEMFKKNKLVHQIIFKLLCCHFLFHNIYNANQKANNLKLIYSII